MRKAEREQRAGEYGKENPYHLPCNPGFELFFAFKALADSFSFLPVTVRTYAHAVDGYRCVRSRIDDKRRKTLVRQIVGYSPGGRAFAIGRHLHRKALL